VYVNGGFICLQAASKIAHFHRRIVKLASSMHAERSCDFGFRMTSGASSPSGLDDVYEEGADVSTSRVLNAWIKRADAYQQRAALGEKRCWFSFRLAWRLLLLCFESGLETCRFEMRLELVGREWIRSQIFGHGAGPNRGCASK
jgi:hypothetical protein